MFLSVISQISGSDELLPSCASVNSFSSILSGSRLKPSGITEISVFSSNKERSLLKEAFHNQGFFTQQSHIFVNKSGKVKLDGSVMLTLPVIKIRSILYCTDYEMLINRKIFQGYIQALSG